ncbi:hypothetical protein Pcinc_011048 [Petrolisthes cinctipes]|uniref:Uncharacterized protein n=1 Tax=Petrolisthes cinctipes TaxID=88211 RepID=A0AAE1G239_PETCI|nr:hypothetical protein Pcinc_011048 [Petrolisthes cinctipes]
MLQFGEFKITEGSEKQSTNAASESKFSDCTDGSAFKNNALFNENANAIKIILYQDAFEVCNPLGSGMEEIKSSLLAVLPDLDSALLNEVVDHLVKEVGVKVPEDFKFIEYDDLPMLKPIQRRKYLDNLKKGVLLASTLTREQRQKRRKIVHITHQCTPRSLA